MNNTEFVKAIAAKTGYAQKDIKEVVNAAVNVTTEALTKGEEVKISGFGKFTVVERAPRVGVNPSTGEKIQLGASKSPKFKASTVLKKIVKES